MTSSSDGTAYEKMKSGLVLDARIELIERIGACAQGQVWRVRELVMPRRECAAKLFCVPAEERHSAFVERIRVDFENETKNLGILERKRFVINLHYIVEGIVEIDGDQFYVLSLVMEFSEIGDLGRFIQTTDFKQAQPYSKIEVMRSIAQGLQEAHAYQIFHSDIKPSNILMFLEGREYIPKLADFGVAIRAGDFGGPRGTPAYMAPEVLDGCVGNGASDIFSLGLLFHEIVAGKHPFHIKPDKSLDQELANYRNAYRTLNYNSSLITEDYGNLPRLISRMLDKDPQKRPRASTVVSALQGIGAIIHVTTPVENGPLHQDRFLWNPQVHLKLNCKRHLFFLHSSHPDSDVRWLQSRLREAGIMSFSLHRVLGAYDFVLDCWLDSVLAHKANRLFEAYESERRVNRLVKHEVDDYEPKGPPPADWIDLESDELVGYITNKLAALSFEDQQKALSESHLVIGNLRDGYSQIHVFLTIEASRDLDPNEMEYYFEVISRYMFPSIEVIDLGYNTHRLSRLVGLRAFLLEFGIDNFTSYGAILFGLAASIDKKIFTSMRVDFFYKSFVGLDAQPIVSSDDGLISTLTAQEFRFSR